MTIKEILDEFEKKYFDTIYDTDEQLAWLEQKFIELIESVPEVKKKESGNKDYCKGYMNGIIDSWKEIKVWKDNMLNK